MSSRVFIIGDIHGCSKTFKKLILEGIGIKKSDKIYCLGDYIDRGPDSKGVIDFILKLRKEGYRIHTLRGNHEEMMLCSDKDEKSFSLWIKNGGDKALESFNIDSIAHLNSTYLSFLRRTRLFIETRDFILVHAGLNFAIQKPLSDKFSMLWIRHFPVDLNYLNGKILIHGHTPRTREQILAQRFESPINIDGGCVFKHIKGYGSLFALNFYERKLIEVRNID
jgi:serine/threonine protein phosphatase 1